MVRARSWTEVEQIAILKAVLANKDILEEPIKPNKRFMKHTDAWRHKWDEVATSIDAYFGTSRGSVGTRKLYQQWKIAATRKFKSMKTKKMSAEDFEATLTMAERILQKICPNIFPKLDTEVATSPTETADKSADGGSDEVANGSSEGTENGQESSNDDEQAESAEKPEVPTNDPEGTDAQAQVAERQDSELSELVLSLQSMIDIQQVVKPSDVEDVLAALENSDNKMEGLDDIAEALDAHNGDAGPSLAPEKTAMSCDDPPAKSAEPTSTKSATTANNAEHSPREESKEVKGMKKDRNSAPTEETVGKSSAKEMTEEKMEVVPNAEVSNEEKAKNSTEKPEETSEASASEPAVKRKKAPRARNAKKRKLTKDTSVRV